MEGFSNDFNLTETINKTLRKFAIADSSWTKLVFAKKQVRPVDDMEKST